MAGDIDSAGFEAARIRMVDGQVRPADVTRPDVIDAMLWAPRERFLPKSKRGVAYMGDLVELAPGRFELDPRTLAKMIDALAPTSKDLALVVGAGGGYASAVLSRICAAVVSLEQDESLAASAKEALSEVGVDTVIDAVGPHSAGCAQHAPYNIVLVNGAVPAGAAGGRDPLEEILSKQLADGGRLATLRGDGAAGWCELLVRTGEGWGGRRAFEAAGPVLAGFEPKREFEF